VVNAVVLAFIGRGRVPFAPRGCVVRPHAVETVLLASSVLASSTGCSFALHGAGGSFDLGPRVERHATSGCAGSDARPVVDTVVGSTLIVVGTALIVSGTQKTNEGWLIAGGAGIIALGGVYVVSAATGYDRTAYCRESMQALAAPPHPSPKYLLDVGALAHAGADPGL
jgi:hypothetical protein